MNNKIKSEKYRKLSIASLVTGILTIISTPLIGIFILGMAMSGPVGNSIITFIIFLLVIYSTLPITAIVCGSIDLKKINAGLYSKNGRGMDITGITIGSLFMLNSIYGIFLL